MILALIRRVDPKSCTLAVTLALLASTVPGCGSSNSLTNGVQGSAKEKKEEERYRYEGTGKAKRKTLIRRQDERLKELKEKSAKSE